jgi:hypothetical protein
MAVGTAGSGLPTSLILASFAAKMGGLLERIVCDFIEEERRRWHARNDDL